MCLWANVRIRIFGKHIRNIKTFAKCTNESDAF